VSQTPTEQLLSLRDRILAAEDIESELVYVRQWDAKLEVRGLTGDERANLLEMSMNPKTERIDAKVLYPAVIVAATYDPATGIKVFTPADMPAIGGKAGGALEQVASVALRLSGLGDNALADAGKDSLKTPNADSTST
jgi:hypothetical protein